MDSRLSLLSAWAWAAVDVKSFVEAADMRLHRPVTDTKVLGDLLFEQALGQQRQNLDLTRPELVVRIARRCRLLKRLHHAPRNAHAHRRATDPHFLNRF
jgi:hypothetical protein